MGRRRTGASRVRIRATPAVVQDTEHGVDVVVMQDVNLLPSVATYLHVVKHEHGQGMNRVPLHLVHAYQQALLAVEDARQAILDHIAETRQWFQPPELWESHHNWVTTAPPMQPVPEADLVMPSLAEPEPEKEEPSMLGLLDPTAEHPVLVSDRYATLRSLDDDPDQTAVLPI